MLPPKPPTSPAQQRLLDCFRKLSKNDREQLVSFAEFLVYRDRTGSSKTGEAESIEPTDLTPLDLPRPESESVVAAIQRLSKTFHMLDKESLLHETSALMSAHIMQGRAADVIIDDLEQLFRQHFDRMMSGNG